LKERKMDELDTGMMMKIISDEVKRHADAVLQEEDLTMMQMRILPELNNCEHDTHSLKELERIFHVSQPAMVKLVKRLEEKQLVETYVLPEDRRVKMVKLHGSVEELCEKARMDIDLTEDRLLKVLSEEEKNVFKKLLKKVYDTIID
jgi:DNA-binding MarR family transcriptional regulator